MHVFLFFIPGILLIFSKAFNRKPLTEFLVYVVGLSLSFFVVLPWLIRPLIPLMLFTYLVIVSSLILLAINYKKIDLKHLNIDRQEIILLGILLLVLFLRCLPFVLQIAPAGADMSMHSYIARLIYDNDGIPRSYEPLFPMSDLGACPTGFPALSAMISLLCGCPIYRSGLLMSCLTYALVCFGLYIFLLRFFDRNTAAAASIAATFLTRSPQWIIRWGGNPTVLALFFFIIAFSLVIELKERPSWLKIIFASLSLAAILITHSIVFYTGVIILAVYFLVSLKDYKNICAIAACLFIFMLIFLLPYLANMKFAITKSAIEYARTLQMIDAKSVIYDLAAGIPFLTLSAFGLPVLFKKSGQLAIVFLIITAVLFLCPGCVALVLIMPLAVFASPSISKILAVQKKHLLIAFTIIGILFYGIFYMYNSVSMCSVTRADIDAFKWMDSVINKRAVIVNNYGDAGLWIPAIIGRTITNPHSEPIHSKELKVKLGKLRANYIYIGSKAVYKDIEFKKEYLEKNPRKYRIVYFKDGAQVWKIL